MCYPPSGCIIFSWKVNILCGTGAGGRSPGMRAGGCGPDSPNTHLKVKNDVIHLETIIPDRDPQDIFVSDRDPQRLLYYLDFICDVLSSFRSYYIQFKEVKTSWKLGAAGQIWRPGAGDWTTQTPFVLKTATFNHFIFFTLSKTQTFNHLIFCNFDFDFEKSKATTYINEECAKLRASCLRAPSAYFP